MVNTFDDIIKVAQSQAQSIPYIKDHTNFWMVRSNNGMFYREFIDKKFIAIGWNALTKNNLSCRDDEYLKQHLKAMGYKDKMPRTAINKCRRFVNELKENDIAVIVGRNEIAFAYIGNYFEYDDASTTTEKEIDVNSDMDRGIYVSDYCPYKKRRHISIITKINLDVVSPMIYRCLVANRHSLSNLNEYADAIISASHDIAYYNNRLIIKYHIGQPRDINPFDFSRFTLNVVKLLAEDERKIVGKYNINSEGDIVLFLLNTGKDIYEFIRDNIATIWVVYAIVFGGKGFGFELPSAVDKIKNWVTEILCRKEIKRIKNAEAAKTEADTAKVNAETEQIRIETEIKKITLDKMRKEKEEEALHIVDQLRQVSTPLQIQPPSQEIINLLIILNAPPKE